MARIQRLFYSTSLHILGMVEGVLSSQDIEGQLFLGSSWHSGEHLHENQLPLLCSFVIVTVTVHFLIPLLFTVYCSYLNL